MRYDLIVAGMIWMLTTVAFTQTESAQYVDLSYVEVSGASILADLSQQYGLQFSYGDLHLEEIISFNYSGTLDGAIVALMQMLDLEHKRVAQNIVLREARFFGKKVKGLIVDQDTKVPLSGATVSVQTIDGLKGNITDEDGYFELPRLEVGRYDISVDYLGYQRLQLNQVLVSSGKEVVLDLEMAVASIALSEIIVELDNGQGSALNEMASAMATSFTVEQSQRYAAAISDPSRMVQSNAGVFNGGDDLSNEIIIRGNSARGMLWRLEGVEIPSPNHFAGLGAGGGAISMLTATSLAKSDFYTGAFPAEFGNALSGVFDLRMRNGNKDKREHHIGFGNLGLDVSTEGYFHKKNNASYIINYRYATLELIDKYLISLGKTKPSYQDLSFKVNIPTEKFGKFALFGLAGKNAEISSATRNPATWTYRGDSLDFQEAQQLGVLGLNHRYLLSDRSYLSTSISLSGYKFRDLTTVLTAQDFSGIKEDESTFDNVDLVGSLAYTHRLNDRQLFRTGVSLNRKWFSYDYETKVEDEWFFFLGNNDRVNLLQSFAQWRTTFKDRWKVNYGVHFSYLFLNETHALDPRFSIDYNLDKYSVLSIASGLYSRSEHPSTYFIERVRPNEVVETPNKSLPFSRAFHVVMGYQTRLNNRIRFKTELYFQHLYQIPVSGNNQSTYSVLNSTDIFDIIFGNDSIGSTLVGTGVGQNYGIEFTLERPLRDGFYYLGTLSLFDAKYKTQVDRFLPARTANNYVSNFLMGKEWSVGKKELHFFSLNGRVTFAGGNRVFPVDLEASQAANENVFNVSAGYQDRTKDYFRIDLGMSIRLNLFDATHTISLDIQNITNRINVLSSFYDSFNGELRSEFQNGIIPFIGYAIDFSSGNK